MELKLSTCVYYSHATNILMHFSLELLADSSMCGHVNHDVFQRDICGMRLYYSGFCLEKTNQWRKPLLQELIV